MPTVLALLAVSQHPTSNREGRKHSLLLGTWYGSKPCHPHFLLNSCSHTIPLNWCENFYFINTESGCSDPAQCLWSVEPRFSPTGLFERAGTTAPERNLQNRASTAQSVPSSGKKILNPLTWCVWLRWPREMGETLQIQNLFLPLSNRSSYFSIEAVRRMDNKTLLAWLLMACSSYRLQKKYWARFSPGWASTDPEKNLARSF